MKYIIKEDINVIYEIYKTFWYLANEDYEFNNFNMLLDKYNIDKDKYKKTNLKKFYKFIETFKNLNKIPMEKIKFYFSDINNGITQSGKCLYDVFITNMSINDMCNFKAKINLYNEQQLTDFVIREIKGFLKLNFDAKKTEGIVSKETFIKYLIEDIDLNYESKWRINVVVENNKSLINELIDILLSSVDNFKTAFKALENEKSKFINLIKELQSEDENFLSNLCGMNVNLEIDLPIYPTMIDFKAINVSQHENTILSIDEEKICYIGWKFQELLNLFNIKNNQDEILQEKIKCISDKSKYEILKMLKKGPMYGQQIAEKLSLTTATISYHMNSLTLNRLVIVDKTDNKIYYSSNEEEIEKMINLLTEQLLDKK